MNVIGVNVREVEGRARPIIAPANTGNTALLIRSQRGPAHFPVRVQGFAEFVRVFGGHDANTLGAAVTESYFDNGGAEALCVRVTGDTSAAARQDLADRNGTPTLRVEAGWRGRQNPGDWANQLEVTVSDNPLGSSAAPAQIAGSLGAPFQLSAGQDLDISIDGGTAQTVTFQTTQFDDIGQATAEEVAAAIRQAVPTVAAFAVPGGRIVITGRNTGTERRLVISGTAATELGFSGTNANSDAGLEGVAVIALRSTSGFGTDQAVRVSTHGRIVAGAALSATTAITADAEINVAVDGGIPQTVRFTGDGRIADLAAATPNEIVAEINRLARGFTASLSPAGELILASLSAGIGSAIAVTPGAPTDALPTLNLAGAAPVAGATVAETITEQSDGDNWIGLNAQLPSGTTLPYGSVRIETAEVDIAVLQDSIEMERFTSVGMQAASAAYAVDVVNDALAGSNFIRLVDLGSASPVAFDLPATVVRQAMSTPGADPAPAIADYSGNPTARTGFHALDTEDFELLALSDTTDPLISAEAIAYCAEKGTAIAIVTPTADFAAAAAIDYAAPLRSAVSYGAAVWPHVQILSRSGGVPLRTIPPVGAYCGMLARVGRDTNVWTSPAGSRAFMNVASLVPGSELTDVEHTDMATRGGIAVIRAVTGRGIAADSARNLSTNASLRLVSQRRLTNLIKVSLARGLKSFLQESVTPSLFSQVRDSVGAFMSGLWRLGAFGTEDRENGFVVICDESNNPPTQTQLGILAVEIRFRTPTSAEFIIVQISQSPAETVASDRT